MRRASAFDPTLLRIDTMVAVRDIHLKDNFTLDEWVSSLTLSESDKNQLRTVYQYCLTPGDEALTNRPLVRGSRWWASC
jgi:GTP pyrophosphokinase